MKNSLIILFIAILSQACNSGDSSNVSGAETSRNMIAEVESNLMPQVFIAGDSTWTIVERMEHYGVPGVSMAVINNGEIEWTKTYGVVNKETKVPVTNQTLFQAASISKPVSSYGALRLVEQGKMDLNQNINTYLTSWELEENEFMADKKVTLKNLLSHTAGTTVHGFWGYSPGLDVPSLVQVLKGEEPANSPPVFVDKTPEESFRYSGGGYCIVQQAMIDLEGKDFPTLMADLVLNPLGMTQSTFDQPLSGTQLERAATGYLPDGTMTAGERHTYPEMAAAGLWTTAEDLAKFAVNIQQTLKGEKSLALSKELTNTMLTPYIEEFPGLGIFINQMGDATYFSHGGWDEGFSSELFAHKDEGYGVVVLTNSNHPDFVSELIRSVAYTYDWAEFVPVYTPLDMEAAELAQMTGRYKNENGDVIKLYQEDEKFYFKPLVQVASELMKVTDSTFITRDSRIEYQFKADSSGTPILQGVRNYGEVAVTITKMSDDEKMPLEYLLEGDFEMALEAYQQLKALNPSHGAVNEENININGYQLMGVGKTELAKDLFEINTILYPTSSNVYDSYAEACMNLGDVELAIANYQKSNELDPQNIRALELIKEMQDKLQN